MKGLFHPALLCLCLISTRLVAVESTLDAGHLKQGTFSYHDMDRGKQIGTSSISIRILANGNYEFSNNATFTEGFSGFHSQHWQAIAASNFEPISANLEFVDGSQSSPVFDLRYAAHRVSGFVVERKASVPSGKRPIDDRILENTVDQRIDWAAAISSSLSSGKQAEFSVYDPSTGVSRVIEHVGKSETIETPAGSFSAIRITYEVEMRGKVERYVVFTTRKTPRLLIREDFPNGVVTELVGMAE
jgi:hypothetical protein